MTLTERAPISQTETSPPQSPLKKNGAEPFRLPLALEILLGIAVALELAAPFFAKSYGVDGPSQLNLIGQFTNLVSRGVLLPRWVPNGVFGFGIGSFYFYPPVAFYISSIVRLVTGATDVRFLFQMTGLAATILSFFAARPLLRALGASRYGTNLGALLYAFAPFQIAEIYSRSSISSHVGYIFVPLVWYGLVAIAGRTRLTRLQSIVVLGVSSALLALTSVPLALAMMLCIAIAGIVARRYLTRSVLADAALAAALALALSAFHFTAVLSARPYAQLGDLTVSNPEYLLTDLLHGAGLPAGYHAGILYVSWALIGIVFLRSRAKLSGPERMAAQLALAVGAFIALLELPFLSRPLYAGVQPFMLIQGSWRFYIQLVMIAIVAVAIARTPAMKRASRSIAWIWILGAIAPALLVIFNLHVYQHATEPASDPTEYLPVYTIHVQMEGYGKFKQHSADPAALANLEGNEHLSVQMPNPTSENVLASLSQAHRVVFHRLYWPYWKLEVNGKNIPSYPDSLGRAVAELPAGNYTATWNLSVAPLEQAGRWISLATLCGIVIGFAVGIARKRFSRKEA
ncbi:MAG TPA: hypothetical protein VFH95_14485 [Candidatus Kapabacteria bacterium]|nr:hypothetical protein [Candidatus Kapabacteria bacterium]